MVIDEPINTVANALLVDVCELVDQIFSVVLWAGWKGRTR